MLLVIDHSAQEPLVRAATISFFVFIIAVNVLWITVKIVLWAHGDRSWFSLHTRDLQKLKSLALREQHSATRLCYDVLRYALHVSFVLLFVVPLSLLAINSFVVRAH